MLGTGDIGDNVGALCVLQNSVMSHLLHLPYHVYIRSKLLLQLQTVFVKKGEVYLLLTKFIMQGSLTKYFPCSLRNIP